MDLTLLAPDIEGEPRYLSPVKRGQDPITPRELRYVMQTPVREEQREWWAETAATLQSALAQSVTVVCESRLQPLSALECRRLEGRS